MPKGTRQNREQGEESRQGLRRHRKRNRNTNRKQANQRNTDKHNHGTHRRFDKGCTSPRRMRRRNRSGLCGGIFRARTQGYDRVRKKVYRIHTRRARLHEESVFKRKHRLDQSGHKYGRGCSYGQNYKRNRISNKGKRQHRLCKTRGVRKRGRR